MMTYAHTALPEPEFVGQLTAPFDEAELAVPDPEPRRSHVGRGLAFALLGLSLLVVPGAIALNVLDARAPSPLTHDLAVTTTLHRWWTRATAWESPLPVSSFTAFVPTAVVRNDRVSVVADPVRASDWTAERDGSLSSARLYEARADRSGSLAAR